MRWGRERGWGTDRPEQIWPQLDNSQGGEDKGGEGGWDVSVPPKASLVCRHFVVQRRRGDIRTALKAGTIHVNNYVQIICLHFLTWNNVAQQQVLWIIVTMYHCWYWRIRDSTHLTWWPELSSPSPESRNENAPSKNCRDWRRRRPRWYWMKSSGGRSRKHQPQNLPGKFYFYRVKRKKSC